MNYLKIYDSIIEKARKRCNSDGTYLEKHHIVPKCIGGTNNQENLVKLTAREHYMCHLLLAKIHNIKKLWAAFSMMCKSSSKHHRIYNNKQYEKMRIAAVKAFSGEGNGMFGKISAMKNKTHTNETREKIRQSKLGKKRKPFNRKPASLETKLKISLSKKGKSSKLRGRVLEKHMCESCKRLIGGLPNYTKHIRICEMRV